MRNDIIGILRNRIITLTYRPGHPLNEKKLAEEFGISRTPIRETLIRLSEENLVTIIPNAGARVSDINLVDFQELIGFRLILERGVAQLAAQNVKKEHIQELERLNERIRLIKNKDNENSEMMDCDTKFHEIIRQAAHNRLLEKSLSIIQNQFTRIQSLISHIPQIMPVHVPKTIQALKERNTKEMERLMVEHVHFFVSKVRDYFSVESGK